jgi:2-methylcitrate dehydratase PrpD
MGARLLKLSSDKLREALGIAEYHGPRSQMMRVIDTPTMLHDGSAWGALAGATAVYLADQGFTGAPAVTVEAQEVDHIWRDLGESWVVHRHYIKPYPVCRWTHALIDAALQLRREHKLTGADIAAIELTSFHEATRLYREVPATSPVARSTRSAIRSPPPWCRAASASRRSRGRGWPIPKRHGLWPPPRSMNRRNTMPASRPIAGAR